MAEIDIAQFEETLRHEARGYQLRLDDDVITRLGQYYALVQKWNPRLHLVAPCTPKEFATRHVLESLMALRFISEGASVADIGSGAGLPIIPCLIAEPSLHGVLIEASPKKAVFLREFAAQVGLDASVIAERFERIPAPNVQFVTCRALERFSEMLREMIDWAPPSSNLLLFGGEAIESELKSFACEYERIPMPNSTARYLFTVKAKAESA